MNRIDKARKNIIATKKAPIRATLNEMEAKAKLDSLRKEYKDTGQGKTLLNLQEDVLRSAQKEAEETNTIHRNALIELRRALEEQGFDFCACPTEQDFRGDVISNVADYNSLEAENVKTELSPLDEAKEYILALRDKEFNLVKEVKLRLEDISVARKRKESTLECLRAVRKELAEVTSKMIKEAFLANSQRVEDERKELTEMANEADGTK